MTKEELIELLNTLNFEEVKCMTLSYYKKKPKKMLVIGKKQKIIILKQYV